MRFGVFAERYEGARPAYPREAVAWLLEDISGLVVELGAGTGKFTAGIAALGLQVVATEPDLAMLKVLRSRLPQVYAVQATAEAIPVRSAQAVVAAQAWHWFDAQRAWESAIAVVGEMGRIGLVWNAPSQRLAWQQSVMALGPVISPVTEEWWPSGVRLEGMEKALFYWDEWLSPRQVRDECATHLAVRKLSPLARESYLDEVQAIATSQARTIPGGAEPRVRFERLTWCARTLRGRAVSG